MDTKKLAEAAKKVSEERAKAKKIQEQKKADELKEKGESLTQQVLDMEIFQELIVTTDRGTRLRIICIPGGFLYNGTFVSVKDMTSELVNH